ncbi:MAG: hydantoinase B/oxoprolinase family protein [Betaproteobacteria bacterium]|nr:hydantoinase B/oxoprolinase family protein [Betaproteobacteria bacterium]
MIDPVTLAVVRGSLEQIADEMDLHLIHAAISPIISETNDCAHGIFQPETGETIAQGRYGLPVFLANMQFTTQNVVKLAQAQGGFKRGDIWILNDPYVGGTHLQDAQLVAPYFVGDRLFALFGSTGHWMDVGGSVAGGWAPKAQDIHQEGTVIPPVKIYDQGKLNEALVSMFRANTRLPNEIAGDLSAMLNVFAVGQRGLDMLVARYGVDTLNECIAEMIARSEQQMRSYIAEIPDGTYRFEDAIDNDGIVDQPLKIALALTVKGSLLHFDFTGTSGTARGPVNLSRNTTLSSCYVAMKHIFPEVPVNGGAFRPASFTIPDRTIISAEYPTPVGGYLEVLGRVIAVVFGALGQAIPERTPASPFGTIGVCTVGGRHPDTGNFFVGVFPYPGGYGATHASDGLVHGTPPQSMANFVSLEMSEHRYPLRFDFFRLREDSGGAGWHRGGCGSEYQFTAWADCGTTVLGDQCDYAPFGVAGGGPAAPNVVEFRTGGKVWRPPMRSKQDSQVLHDGDSLHACTPGGGGFGDPLDRDVAAVERDLNQGYVSRATAEHDYGAIIAEAAALGDRKVYRIDVDATAAERARRRAGQMGDGRRIAS